MAIDGQKGSAHSLIFAGNLHPFHEISESAARPENSLRTSVRSCFTEPVANYPKAIISVTEVRRDAGTCRASRNLDLVPPGASARSSSLALFRPLRISIR